MKKKICFISPHAYALFNPKINSTFGGAEVQMSLISKAISKNKNFDVNLMVADYGQKDIEKFEKVKIWNSMNLNNTTFNQAKSFFKVFKKINADVYIQRTLTRFSGLIAIYCKLTKKKFIYMVANDGETDESHRLYSTFLNKILSRLVFRFAKKIIVQNQYQKKALEKKYNPEKIILIKSLYNMHKPIFKKKENILWVGRLDNQYKRPEIFLKLANQFPDEKFVMISPIADGQEKTFKNIKKTALKIKNLEFIEYVPFKNIQKYFDNAKIFVNTSIQEGFPNTFIQAGMGKTPILSLNVNPNKFITKYNCGYYCNNSYENIVKNLKKLLKNKNDLKNKGNNVFIYVKNNHDINKKIMEMTKLLK
jgi:hypothetical protein